MLRLLTAAFALASVIGCGAAPAELNADSVLDAYADGIDPVAEANAQIERLMQNDWRVTRRVDGTQYVAFQAEKDVFVRIRVVTRRGTVLAVDAGDVADDFTRASLMPLERASNEIVVRTRASGAQRDCHALHWVHAGGELTAVQVQAPDVADACIERIDDVDGDGVLDAFISERLSDLNGLIAAPQVFLPLLPSASGTLVFEQNARTERLLQAMQNDARDSVDASTSPSNAVRAALQVARYAYRMGQGEDGVVRAFDQVIERVPSVSYVLMMPAREYVASWTSAVQ